MSTYETTVGLGDERVRILPQGVSKKPLLHTRYTRIVEAMWSNRADFVERRSDGALYFGMPKSFSEVRDDEGYLPLRPKCRMRVQNYCFFLTWQWVGSDCVRYWSGSCASACCFLTNTAFLKKTKEK